MVCLEDSILQWGMQSLVSLACLLGLVACGPRDRPPPMREVTIQQNWSFQPGAEVAGHAIRGGLGDISIDLRGGNLYAPFDGQLQPHQEGCVIFSSAQVPAYLLRLCGVERPKLGRVRQGEVMASSHILSFAMLRKHPDGTWALVEPANSLLERLLSPMS
jgi:hypothetical protein